MQQRKLFSLLSSEILGCRNVSNLSSMEGWGQSRPLKPAELRSKFLETFCILQECIENAHSFQLICLRVFAALKRETQAEFGFSKIDLCMVHHSVASTTNVLSSYPLGL